MERIYLNKEHRKIIEQAMSKKVRRDYKNGEVVVIKIVRELPQKRWGNYLVITLSKNGEILDDTTLVGKRNWNMEMDLIKAKDVVDNYICGKNGYDWKVEKILY